jgi:(p)ppGpp synthase/HD superfamily hydrolase
MECHVVNTLREFNHNDEELLAAAWLHDIIEDTSCRPLDLCIAKIPPYTIALVDAVTDRPGANRRERHVLTYPLPGYRTL